MADIFISYKRGTDEPQVEAIVGGLRGAHDVTVRDNNLTACAASHAIRAPAPNMHLILDNTGARASPLLERGADQDFYRY